jgi:HAE1 family hydrophobic/amphiphilic exporter-1
MKLAEISIKRPSLVIVLFTILTPEFSYSQLGYELIPKFETNVISIATVYPEHHPVRSKIPLLKD